MDLQRLRRVHEDVLELLLARPGRDVRGDLPKRVQVALFDLWRLAVAVVDGRRGPVEDFLLPFGEVACGGVVVAGIARSRRL